MPINKGAKYYKLNISKIVNCQTRQRAQIKKTSTYIHHFH